MKEFKFNPLLVITILTVYFLVSPGIDLEDNGNGTCIADTFLAGSVSGEWYPEVGNYLIYDSIWVENGNSLIIHPGVNVKFASGIQGISVYGTLQALGSESDSIYFTSNQLWQQPGDWGRVLFSGPQANQSLMQYCVVSFAEKGIYVNNSAPELKNCSIRKHSQQGIYAVNSNLLIDSCEISYCEYTGILIVGGEAYINGSYSHHHNNNGIIIDGVFSSEITGSVFEYNNNIGIYIDNDCYDVELSYNFSAFNAEYGIKVEECNSIGVPIVIEHNVIHHNTLDGIYCDNSNIKITNNTITFNFRDGIFCYSGNLTFYNNIVDRNSHRGVYLQNVPAIIDYNDVWNNSTQNYLGCTAGPHDISDNPQYASPTMYDYHLQEDSPCIDAGNPSPIYNDPDGTRSDIGALYYNQSGVKDRSDDLTADNICLRNFPNPFNGETIIEVKVSRAMEAPKMISIYNVLGQLVRTIEISNNHINTYKWNGLDDKDEPVPSGVYYASVGNSPAVKMILLR